MMALVGMDRGSALYWVLKVAVPHMSGGRTFERGVVGGGILEAIAGGACCVCFLVFLKSLKQEIRRRM